MSKHSFEFSSTFFGQGWNVFHREQLLWLHYLYLITKMPWLNIEKKTSAEYFFYGVCFFSSTDFLDPFLLLLFPTVLSCFFMNFLKNFFGILSLPPISSKTFSGLNPFFKAFLICFLMSLLKEFLDGFLFLDFFLICKNWRKEIREQRTKWPVKAKSGLGWVRKNQIAKTHSSSTSIFEFMASIKPWKVDFSLIWRHLPNASLP